MISSLVRRGFVGDVTIVNWHNIDERVRDDAIRWHVRLSSGEASGADYERFSTWLSEDPEHFRAYEKAEAFSSRIEALRDGDHAPLDALVVIQPEIDSGRSMPAFPVRRSMLAAAIAAVMLAAVAVGYFTTPLWRSDAHRYAASATEFRTVALDDGSTVILGPGAAMTTEFRRNVRNITSLSGVGFFEVASDKTRPFKIAFGSREIVVVGTKFEVSSFDDFRSVAVARGTVVVQPANAEGDSGAAGKVSLTPGNKFTMTEETPSGVLAKVEPDEVGAWRAGYLEFNDASIKSVVRKLNAFYGSSVFSIRDDSLKGMRFDGILTLSDASGTARRLAELLPITATPSDGGFELSADEG